MYHKKKYSMPTPPIESVIVHVPSGQACYVDDDGNLSPDTPIFTSFASRTLAKKALARVILSLPKKSDPHEADLYRVSRLYWSERPRP